MSESQQSIELNIIELTNIAANILDQLFIRAPKDKAKNMFKDIKQGKTVPLGKIKIQESLNPPLQLSLDYSEFRGPGFNFDAFSAALKGILSRVSEHMQAKKDFDVLSSEDGTALIHLPGIIQIQDQYNVMLMALELGTLEKITLKLMFVDPSQYESLKS